MQMGATVDPINWDPFVLQSGAGVRMPLIWSRLTLAKPGHLADPEGDISGDLAESWESSPDGLTLTFKLRQNAWHNIAPVNGRAVDAQDVAFTWKRFEAESPNRGSYSHKTDPASPILSVDAIDSRTVTMKLAFPMATLLALLTQSVAGSFWIMPKEADGGFDPKQVCIGSGPFYLSEHVVSSRFAVKHHTGFYDKSNPFIDGAVYYTIPEYATGLSQFKAGSIFTWGVRAEDILPTKQDVPQLHLYEDDYVSAGKATVFGYRPEPGAMFRDERLRQAYSMSIDRDLVIDVSRDVTNFQNEGIPVQTRWFTSLNAALFPGFWLDPKSSDFGPNSKYFRHDVAEAKKLMTAAGFPNGLDVVSTMVSGRNYGADYPQAVEILEGMTSEAGFRYQRNVVDYQTEFLPKYSTSKGDFEGLAYMNLLPANPGDPIEGFVNTYSKSSTRFVGLDPNGKGDKSGDPHIEDQIAKARVEKDVNKRRLIAYDLQRYLAQKAYVMYPAGAASGLSLWWPAVRNVNVYIGEYRSHYYQWLDDSQPPLKST